MNANINANTAANNEQSDNAITVEQIIADNVATNPSIKQLAEERKAWEAGAYRTSNQQLYSVLAKCLSYYDVLSACRSKTSGVRASFNEFVAANDIRFKEGTPVINKIVKCVFYESAVDRNAQRDRRRISAYALVLRRAQTDNVKPDALPAYIEQNGGIEQIRLGKSSGLTMTAKAQEARSVVEAGDSYIAVVSDRALMQRFDTTDYDKAFVAVIVPRPDGTVEVRAVVKGAAAVNASLAAIYGKDVAPQMTAAPVAA